MTPTLTSLTAAWTDATSFNSARVRLAVVALAAVASAVVAWQVSVLWEQLYGYSTVVTVLSTFATFVVAYGGLGFLASALLADANAGSR